MTCIFCQIANKSLNTPLLYEDGDVIAFQDINPQAPLHALIIPKKHIHSLHDSQSEDQLLLGKMLITAKKIAHDHGYHEQGYRLVMNTGSDGGQTIFHIHLHLLAGRPLTWPPG
ncbi:MAG: histidine triad family protein [Pseudomonadota bacterium]|nr:histidine triad family protein [Pseudomonadota bacterium]